MIDDDISPMRRPEDMPPIRTQADVWRHWRTLMGPLGFSERLLWIQFLHADGRVVPVLQQITELPRLPEPRLVDNLMGIFERVCADLGVGSVALLMSRPGPAGITAAERSWARHLVDAALAAEVAMWPVHVANDYELVAVTPDDMVKARVAVG